MSKSLYALVNDGELLVTPVGDQSEKYPKSRIHVYSTKKAAVGQLNRLQRKYAGPRYDDLAVVRYTPE